MSQIVPGISGTVSYSLNIGEGDGIGHGVSPSGLGPLHGWGSRAGHPSHPRRPRTPGGGMSDTDYHIEFGVWGGTSPRQRRRIRHRRSEGRAA